MAEDIGKEIAPFARKSKTLLRQVNKELATIPDYKLEGNRVNAIADAVTAIRRGIRLLKGKESKPSLEKKKQKLETFLKRAEELKGATRIKGTKTILYNSKGGSAIKKAVGPQDFRKGGMTLFTADNRKKK